MVPPVFVSKDVFGFWFFFFPEEKLLFVKFSCNYIYWASDNSSYGITYHINTANIYWTFTNLLGRHCATKHLTFAILLNPYNSPRRQEILSPFNIGEHGSRKKITSSRKVTQPLNGIVRNQTLMWHQIPRPLNCLSLLAAIPWTKALGLSTSHSVATHKVSGMQAFFSYLYRWS